MFSVIIPLYNAEATMRRSIDSILNQSYKDFELILVNDGSSDNTSSICEEYASRDNRIKLINQTNGGVSKARNAGIAASNGAWIVFVDCDDWLDASALSYFAVVGRNNDIDYIFCDYFINERRQSSGCYGTFCPTEFVEKNECDKIWNGCYKSPIIKKNVIRFDEDITLAEDRLFNYQYLASCRTVFVSQEAFYHYSFSNTNSLSYTGFSIENFSECHVRTHRALRRLNRKVASCYLKGSFKGMVWKRITEGQSFGEILEYRKSLVGGYTTD